MILRPIVRMMRPLPGHQNSEIARAPGVSSPTGTFISPVIGSRILCKPAAAG